MILAHKIVLRLFSEATSVNPYSTHLGAPSWDAGSVEPSIKLNMEIGPYMPQSILRHSERYLCNE